MPNFSCVPLRLTAFWICFVAAGMLPAPIALAEVLSVRLLELFHPRTIAISASHGSLTVFTDAAKPVLVLERGQKVTLEVHGRSVRVQAQGRNITAAAVRFAASDGALLRLQLVKGSRNLPSERTYHGGLAVCAAGTANNPVLQIINQVNLEDYIAGVLPGEYPFPEIEGVKAQAVIARTYALRSRGKFNGYDLVDHVGSQVYEGASRETDLSRRAAYATEGEVLVYRGALIDAVYSSTCGGHTADNESIWTGAPMPYLRGKPDPFDGESPHLHWEWRVAHQSLHRILSAAYGFTVTGIEMGPASAEGRIRSVVLVGRQRRHITGNEFRLLLSRQFGAHSLKSTRFKLSSTGDHYVFQGNGFGHGVGMCQWGARGKAIAGHSYREIIDFYYTGVQARTYSVVTPASAP